MGFVRKITVVLLNYTGFICMKSVRNFFNSKIIIKTRLEFE